MDLNSLIEQLSELVRQDPALGKAPVVLCGINPQKAFDEATNIGVLSGPRVLID